MINAKVTKSVNIRENSFVSMEGKSYEKYDPILKWKLKPKNLSCKPGCCKVPKASRHIITTYDYGNSCAEIGNEKNLK